MYYIIYIGGGITHNMCVNRNISQNIEKVLNYKTDKSI